MDELKAEEAKAAVPAPKITKNEQAPGPAGTELYWRKCPEEWEDEVFHPLQLLRPPYCPTTPNIDRSPPEPTLLRL